MQTPYQERIGYACINMTLGQENVTTNRHAVQKTFYTKGLPHISKLCLANVNDLEKVVRWNEENGFKFYRISSSLFPWMTEYMFDDLPDWEEIKSVLRRIGSLQRVSDNAWNSIQVISSYSRPPTQSP